MSNHGASEFGKDLGLVHECIVLGREVGAGRDFFKSLANDPDLFARAAAFVRLKADVPAYEAWDAEEQRVYQEELAEAERLRQIELAKDDFTVIVDGRISQEQAIAAGNYGHVHFDFTSRLGREEWRMSGRGPRRVTIRPVRLKFPRMSNYWSDDVHKCLRELGLLRHALIDDLLAVGAQFPEKQREMAMVAFGYRRKRRVPTSVPVLSMTGPKDKRERILDCDRRRSNWTDYVRALMVVSEEDLPET